MIYEYIQDQTILIDFQVDSKHLSYILYIESKIHPTP